MAVTHSLASSIRSSSTSSSRPIPQRQSALRFGERVESRTPAPPLSPRGSSETTTSLASSTSTSSSLTESSRTSTSPTSTGSDSDCSLPPSDDDSYWQSIPNLTSRPTVVPFPYPLPPGPKYTPRKISAWEDTDLRDQLRRGGDDIYSHLAKKDTPQGEPWRRGKRALIENMSKKGELSVETVKMVDKLWLMNPSDEKMVVRRPRKPKSESEKKDDGCIIM